MFLFVMGCFGTFLQLTNADQPPPPSPQSSPSSQPPPPPMSSLPPPQLLQIAMYSSSPCSSMNVFYTQVYPVHKCISISPTNSVKYEAVTAGSTTVFKQTVYKTGDCSQVVHVQKAMYNTSTVCKLQSGASNSGQNTVYETVSLVTAFPIPVASQVNLVFSSLSACQMALSSNLMNVTSLVSGYTVNGCQRMNPNGPENNGIAPHPGRVGVLEKTTKSSSCQLIIILFVSMSDAGDILVIIQFSLLSNHSLIQSFTPLTHSNPSLHSLTSIHHSTHTLQTPTPLTHFTPSPGMGPVYSAITCPTALVPPTSNGFLAVNNYDKPKCKGPPVSTQYFPLNTCNVPPGSNTTITAVTTPKGQTTFYQNNYNNNACTGKSKLTNSQNSSTCVFNKPSGTYPHPCDY